MPAVGKCQGLETNGRKTYPKHKKIPETLRLRGKKEQSALGELGRATSGLQAVLLMFPSYKPLILRAFLRFASEVPPPVNRKNGVYLLPHST